MEKIKSKTFFAPNEVEKLTTSWVIIGELLAGLTPEQPLKDIIRVLCAATWEIDRLGDHLRYTLKDAGIADGLAAIGKLEITGDPDESV